MHYCLGSGSYSIDQKWIEYYICNTLYYQNVLHALKKCYTFIYVDALLCVVGFFYQKWEIIQLHGFNELSWMILNEGSHVFFSRNHWKREFDYLHLVYSWRFLVLTEHVFACFNYEWQLCKVYFEIPMD